MLHDEAPDLCDLGLAEAGDAGTLNFGFDCTNGAEREHIRNEQRRAILYELHRILTGRSIISRHTRAITRKRLPRIMRPSRRESLDDTLYMLEHGLTDNFLALLQDGRLTTEDLRQFCDRTPLAKIVVTRIERAIARAQGNKDEPDLPTLLANPADWCGRNAEVIAAAVRNGTIACRVAAGKIPERTQRLLIGQNFMTALCELPSRPPRHSAEAVHRIAAELEQFVRDELMGAA